MNSSERGHSGGVVWGTQSFAKGFTHITLHANVNTAWTHCFVFYYFNCKYISTVIMDNFLVISCKQFSSRCRLHDFFYILFFWTLKKYFFYSSSCVGDSMLLLHTQKSFFYPLCTLLPSFFCLFSIHKTFSLIFLGTPTAIFVFFSSFFFVRNFSLLSPHKRKKIFFLILFRLFYLIQGLDWINFFP